MLRLLCIQSICNNGFKQKLLEYYKREILQVYGFAHMLTLNNLERCGLLKTQGQRTYPTIRKSLRLIVEEVNEQVGIRPSKHEDAYYIKKVKKMHI